MKRATLIIVLAILLIAVGLWRRDQPRFEFSTDAAEAYHLYQQGNLELISFQYMQAENSLLQAVELDPDFAMAHAALAELYYRGGGTGDTRTLHEQERDIADSLASTLPDDTERLLVQLRLSNLGRVGSARQDSLLEEAESRIPDHLLVMVTHAHRAEQSGDIDQVEATWQEILRVNPNFAHAYNNLGYIAAARGDYDKALDLLKKYVFLTPDLANPHDSLGEILSHIGRYEEAELEFLRALELQPDFFASLVNLARIYIEQGQVDKGLDLMERTRAQMAGSELVTWLDRILVRMFIHNWFPAKLEWAVERFLAEHPDDRYTPFYRAMVWAFSGRADAAEILTDSTFAALRADPDYRDRPRALRQLESWEHRFAAIYATSRQRLETAAEHWQQVLVLSSDSAPHEQILLRLPYAEALDRLGRHQEALAQADIILGINPRNISGLLVATEANLALGHRDDARQALARLESALAKADPDFPAVTRAGRLKNALLES